MGLCAWRIPSQMHVLSALSEHAKMLLGLSVCCPLVEIFFNSGHVSLEEDIEDTEKYLH